MGFYFDPRHHLLVQQKGKGGCFPDVSSSIKLAVISRNFNAGIKMFKILPWASPRANVILPLCKLLLLWCQHYQSGGCWRPSWRWCWRFAQCQQLRQYQLRPGKKRSYVIFCLEECKSTIIFESVSPRNYFLNCGISIILIELCFAKYTKTFQQRFVDSILHLYAPNITWTR